MNLLRLTIVPAAMLVAAVQMHVRAATGAFEAFIIVSDSNNGNLIYYDLPPSATANPDFSGFNFGTFHIAYDSLVINGAQEKTWEDHGDTVSGARLYWRVYEHGTTPDSFLFNTLSNPGGKVGNDRVWESTLNAHNELSSAFIRAGKTYNIDAYVSYFAYPPGGEVSEVSTALRTGQFSVIPEPTSALAVALGILGGALALRRRSRQAFALSTLPQPCNRSFRAVRSREPEA
ncbi:MAG: PEP-CTERM sorting domain-containing protein [Verrucomicrobiales bacterium]|nr:PEP-CTERM sorting domain-containing protein [Verrucomicrobiales bacterium]